MLTFMERLSHVVLVMKKNIIISITIVFIVAGLGMMIGFAFNASFNDGSGVIDPNLASNYGEFIGGVVGTVFTVVGFLVLYLTILEQRQAFSVQQFESKFFELMKIHRENVLSMQHIRPDKKDKQSVEGQKVFVELRSQYFKLFKSLEDVLKTLKIAPLEIENMRI